MVTNTLLLYAWRLRDHQKTAEGYAMPFDLIQQTAYGIGSRSTCVHVLVDFASQGVSVPISRGGPLILDE